MFAQEDLHDALLLLLDDICRLEWNIHLTFDRVRISDVCEGVFESTLRCGAIATHPVDVKFFERCRFRLTRPARVSGAVSRGLRKRRFWLRR